MRKRILILVTIFLSFIFLVSYDEEKPAGSYGIKFDATNLLSGVFFYRL